MRKKIKSLMELNKIIEDNTTVYYDCDNEIYEISGTLDNYGKTYYIIEMYDHFAYLMEDCWIDLENCYYYISD